jgi:hypothetical protein
MLLSLPELHYLLAYRRTPGVAGESAVFGLTVLLIVP